MTMSPEPLPTMTPPLPALGPLLKTATATMHRRVERSAFMSSLLRGQLDRAAYVLLLHNLHALYAALEDSLAAHAGTPSVGPVVMPELFRCRALAADLQALGAAAAPPLARATQKYVQRLGDISAAKPALLVAHAYVRYLGDLNGGQALRRVVARNLGLAGDAGTSFYDFGDSASRQRLEQAFRAGLESTATHQPDLQVLADEALDAFERHEQLFEELSASG
jgi:heme oxygenase